MNHNTKSIPRTSPPVFKFHDYTISSILQQKLDELANIHHKRCLFPPTAKAKSVVSATVSQLRLIVNKRLSAGFYAVKRHAMLDLRGLPVGKLVAMTHCGHCGATGLTLLTSSSQGRISPSFEEKVRMLLPTEADLQGEQSSWVAQRQCENLARQAKNLALERRKTVTARVRSAAEIVKKVIRPRVQLAFEALYLGKGGQFGKDQSLTFEFVSEEEGPAGAEKIYNISRIEQQSSAKLQEESFESEDHILNTIDSDSDPLLTASYSAATILLFSRIEKVLFRRASLFFSNLSPT